MTRPSTIYITLTGNRIRESDKAVMFQIKQISGNKLEPPFKTEWFPLSQTNKMYKDPTQKDCDWIAVSEWILLQKDIKIPAAASTEEDFDEHRALSEEAAAELAASEQDTYDKFDVDNIPW